MPLNFEPKSGRMQFSFAIAGLTDREELLLKSLVRLIDHRTHHQWMYTEQTADVWLVAQGSKAPTTAFLQGKQPQILVFSPTALINSEAQLARPFKAEQIEAALNHTGAILAVSELSQTDQPKSTLVETYKLIRWPTLLVQGNPKRVLIASALLGKHMSLPEIIKQSNAPEADCVEFINALKMEQLVTVKQDHLAPPNPTIISSTHKVDKVSSQASLFSRIRSRLMLKITT